MEILLLFKVHLANKLIVHKSGKMGIEHVTGWGQMVPQHYMRSIPHSSKLPSASCMSVFDTITMSSFARKVARCPPSTRSYLGVLLLDKNGCVVGECAPRAEWAGQPTVLAGIGVGQWEWHMDTRQDAMNNRGHLGHLLSCSHEKQRSENPMAFV